MPEKEDKNDNVRVVVRCRPLNEKEESKGCKKCVKVDEASGVIAVSPSGDRSTEPPKKFTFDRVFNVDCKQTDVYTDAARRIVESVLEGYNGTIFAYGQTGTGKTFTMEGVRSVPELRGIIPNSFAHIFGHIAKVDGDVRFLVRVSYLEIYNENVRDLLGKDQNAKLEVKERPDVGVYVKDLSSYVMNNADDLDRTMTLGNKNRSVGATNMNEQSSRSHAIFSITVECSEKGPDGQQHVRMGKLHLVDLAGSERQSKTGATGTRLKEATQINLSLSTLGNVISALVDGKSTHIPYRNSKLTRLLQDSLGGNSKTVMIANIGPADYNFDETISTLRYANRAKNIKNKAKINEDPKDALLREFQKEIEKLKHQLQEEGEGSGASSSEEEVEVEGVMVKRKKHKKKGHAIPPEKIAEMKAKIEAERAELQNKKDMAEEEKNSVAKELEKREKDLMEAEDEQAKLQEKLKAMESKIIVGGVNLLEKAKEQELLLEQSAKELSERRERQEKLQKLIKEKEQERIDIEEKYASLQDEAAGKTKKLKKVWTMLMSAKSEMADQQQEHQRETEGLLENIRELRRELQRQTLIIDTFVPIEFQDLIEQNKLWNEEIGEWQLRFIAYTGNNMRRATPSPDPKDKHKEVAHFLNLLQSLMSNQACACAKVIHEICGYHDDMLIVWLSSQSQEQNNESLANDTDISGVYLSYNQVAGYTGTSGGEPSRPKTGRPKTASRPKTGKKKRASASTDTTAASSLSENREEGGNFPQSRRLLSPKKHFA